MEGDLLRSGIPVRESNGELESYNYAGVWLHSPPLGHGLAKRGMVLVCPFQLIYIPRAGQWGLLVAESEGDGMK